MTLNNKNKLWKLACGFFGLMLSLAAYADLEPVVISSDAHLTASSTHYADRDVIVDGAVLTLDGEYHFRNLSLTNQARVTHSVEESLYLVVAELLGIEDGASIDVSGRGETGGATGTTATRHGGSHGGAGGQRASDDTFGDFAQPTDFGSAVNTSSRGGGVVRISAGHVLLDGSISADGHSVWRGGGSGGSVWLTVRELSGSGVISANGGQGGSGGSSQVGSGGGGGRIAVYYQLNDGFPIDNVQALGGAATASSYEHGGAGSLYFQDTASGSSTLRFAGSGSDDALSLLSGPIPDGTTLEVINTRVVVDDVDGDANQGSDSLGADRHIRVDDGYLSFRPVPSDALPSRWETVTLEGEAVVSHSEISSNDASTHTGIHWSVGQLTVSEDAAIDVSGRGETGGVTGTTATRHGGSHGGAGGQRPTDETFGDFAQPTGFGSAVNTSNRGGGVVRISAEHVLLDGSISADGHSVYRGGGSGGSVWLTVRELSGSGVISANGGQGGSGGSSQLGSGGGGGRVALYYETNHGFDSFNIEARGGTATGSYSNGGAGSIYFKNTTSGTSTLRYSGSGSADALSLLQGPIPDGTTLEVINTRVVVDDVDDDANQGSGSLGADRHIRVDDGYLSFRPVPSDALPSRWETVTLEGEAVVSHSEISSNDASTHTGIHWSVGQLTVSEDAAIDVSGRGETGGVTGTTATRHGGSHGGAGGQRPTDETFGDFAQPTGFGSAVNTSNRGGGVVRISAEHVLLDGSISADGHSVYRGGGSGGSVWLTVRELSGSGVISANGGQGGSGGSSQLGSGGGGGRVALYYETNHGFDSFNIEARGGTATGSYSNGGAGSIYFKNTTSGTSTLRYSGSGSADALSLLQGPIPDGTTLEVINTRVVVDDVDDDANQGSGSLGADRHIRVDDGYLSFRPVPSDALPSRWETVTLEGEAVVSHSEISSNDASTHTGIHWSVGQLTVSEDAAIDVSGRGETGGATGTTATRHGGSHGGAGGQRPTDETFGDFAQPTGFGSAVNTSNRGGGVVRISAEHVLLDGSISADGHSVYRGGGSGGSVWLTVGELSGRGRLSANGGSGAGRAFAYGQQNR